MMLRKCQYLIQIIRLLAGDSEWYFVILYTGANENEMTEFLQQ